MNLHRRNSTGAEIDQALPRYRRPRYPRGVHTQIDSNSVTVSTSLMSKPSNSAPKPISAMTIYWLWVLILKREEGIRLGA